MVQVRVHEMPPAVAKSPVRLDQVRDASGRIITLRELDPVQESRLTVAVGPEMAINVMYMNMYAFPAAAVADIDGEEYPVPQNPKQIESMLAILGKSGLKAVSGSLRAMSNDRDDEATETAAKN
ncbi:hypothetical protein ORG41_04380 [[Curtobacterium] plantarum]|uniref:hypothetical protein n=1 Tax=[Curtobacterium] plantarum TaxID=221276 RepID=UPI00224B30BC|nr:hypothetical protein [[Curtobacterium] plantarum]MCX2905210.1 hypothetical protein [[Curtobacterium] plantarum]